MSVLIMSFSMKFRAFITLFLLFTALAVSTGCQPRDNSLGMQVKGKVIFDGQPIETGRISFLDKKTNEPTSSSIHRGKYEVRLLPGEKTVKISADKVVGKRLRDSKDPNSGEFEVYEQYIPKRYNDKTTLSFTMDDKTQTKDFELSSE